MLLSFTMVIPRNAICLENNLSISVTDEQIAPTQAEVTPGTTVVWFNHSEHPIKVRFLTKAISTTCKSPKNFKIGNKGIYESQAIAKGQFASLCFLEKQEYDYQVELSPAEALIDSSQSELSSIYLKGMIKVAQ